MTGSKTSLLSLIFFALFLTLFSPYAFSEGLSPNGPEGNIENWTVVESSYATIFVKRAMDLGSIVRRIDVSFARYDPIEEQFFFNKGISDEERLANEIDVIVRKAKKILDMYPQEFHINIRIYESDEELWDIYEGIFNERQEHKAFYIHKFRTIYISLPNISESVLAHEIGHSIIDSYFTVLPPDKIRELLSCYVDVHLKD
jgi:hypothetical protein